MSASLNISPDDPCPCELGPAYKRCCGLVHRRRGQATPEAVVLARYCAYVVDLPRFILASTHPDSSHFEKDARGWTEDIRHFCSMTQFDGIEIIDEEIIGDEAWVTFEVYLTQDGQDASFTERSCLRQHRGRWVFWDAELVS